MEPGGDQLLEMVKKELGADYRIEKELGRGGMAVVYKGVETALERVVAIKVVPPESANAGQAAERFRREARLAASLDHPNIIPVYRVGQAGPLHYMAMKFVEGRAVDAIIESQGALPLSVCIAILRYAAAGLAFAHEKKVVHRDIKGANILVDKDGRVMVSDFGIARALEEVSLTASGMVIGTPYYMSPEQCGGQKISPQSDQYSLGIMGFQMLTGEVPFNADSMVGVIQHHYMTPVPDIRAVRGDVPQELLDIIYCSLNKAPEDRFTTTREMAIALDNVPQTDAEREEAEKLLRELSAGHSIPKVRTGTLPPLTLTISGPAAPVVPRPVSSPRKAQPAPTGKKTKPSRKKKKKALLPLAAAVVLMGASGTFLYFDKIRKDDQNTQAGKGVLEVAGLPPGEMAIIRGLPRGNVVQQEDTGWVAFEAKVDGYEPILDSIRVASGERVVLDFRERLQPVVSVPTATLAGAAPVTSFPRPNSASQPTAPRETQSAALDGEIRASVTPNYATIEIDGRVVGRGRRHEKVTLGSHRVTFSAPNCDAVTLPVPVTAAQKTVILPTQELKCRQ